MNQSDLTTAPNKGLSAQEVKNRQPAYGVNAIEEKKISNLVKFLSFLWGPIPWMIEAALLLSAILQHWEDFWVIFLMLALNALRRLVGFMPYSFGPMLFFGCLLRVA